MQLYLETGSGTYSIDAYAHGEVTVRDTIYTRSLILTPETLVTDWPPNSIQELSAVHFEQVLALEPEIILLGTGQRLCFPEVSITANIMEKMIGLEVMDTAAACRTYNVLMTEGRKVAAALLID